MKKTSSLLFLAACALAQAETIYSTSFENFPIGPVAISDATGYGQDDWRMDTGSHLGFGAVDTLARTGTKSLFINGTDPSTRNQLWTWKDLSITPGPTDKIKATVYIRIPALAGAAVNQAWGFDCYGLVAKTDTSLDNPATIRVRYDKTVEVFNGAGDLESFSVPSIPYDAWFPLEIEFDMATQTFTSSANGVALPHTAPTFASTVIADIDIYMRNRPTTPPLANGYFDDYSVTRTGAGTYVTAKVNLEQWGAGLPGNVAEVLVRDSGNNTIQTITAPLGNNGTIGFVVDGSLAGKKLRIRCDRFLSKLVPATANLGTVSLLNGDCDANNVITSDDYLILSDAFDSSFENGGAVGPWDPRADLDGSLAISTDDYLILSSNFDLSGEDE